jgi:hypothetical protein
MILTMAARELQGRFAGTPGGVIWAFVHPLAIVLIFTETDGAALQAALLPCLDLQAATIIAPVTDRHFSRHPLFLISIPKAGTHLIYELARALGYKAGIEPPEFPRPQSWYCLEYSNSHTTAPDFFVDTVRRAPFGNRQHPFMKSPALFIYRHPLDILVSEAHYYHQDGKSAFAGWFDGLDFSGRAARLLNDNFLLGSLRKRVGAFMPWLDFPNVLSLSFEELVGASGGSAADEQLDLIWSILLKLQIPGDPEAIAASLYNRDSATFRSGQTGGYAKALDADSIAAFAQANQDVLDAFGYSVTAPGALPAQRNRFRRRPVNYTAVDSDAMPITVEANFMGCNLVRYAHRIYVVPLTAGQVDLTKMQAAQLASLPYGSDLATVKTLLITGGEALAERQHALRQLGAGLTSDAPPPYHAYWTDAHTPRVIETYLDFNIVVFQQRFYGIKQSLGAVELAADVPALLSGRSVNDLVVASSVTQVRDEIDGLSTAQRLGQTLQAMQAHVAALQNTVKTQRRQITADVTALKTALATAQTEAAAQTARQDDTINGLAQACRDTAAAVAQAQDQLVTLESEIAALRSTFDHHAATAAATARAHKQSLQRQIAVLQEEMQRSTAATLEAAAKAETTAHVLAAKAETMAHELAAKAAFAIEATHRRLDLQLEELISQRSLLAALQEEAKQRLGSWLRRRLGGSP